MRLRDLRKLIFIPNWGSDIIRIPDDEDNQLEVTATTDSLEFATYSRTVEVATLVKVSATCTSVGASGQAVASILIQTPDVTTWADYVGCQGDASVFGSPSEVVPAGVTYIVRAMAGGNGSSTVIDSVKEYPSL